MATGMVRILLVEESKDRLEDYCARKGMTQISVMSRLVDWFMKQSPQVQGIIQGHIQASKDLKIARKG